MLNKKSLQLLILSALIFSLSIQLLSGQNKKEQPKKRIAVLGFSADKVEESLARIVRNNIELSLFTTKKFDVMELDQVESILKQRKFLLTDCADEECAKEAGGILSADFVILGSVSKLEKFAVQVKVIDSVNKKLVSIQKTEADTEAELRKVSENMSIDIAEEIEKIGRKRKPVSVCASFLYVMPLSYLNDLVDPGMGVNITGKIEDIFFRGIFTGLSVGYIYFSGKTNLTHHSIMLPVGATAGYRLSFSKFLLMPAVYAGWSYISVYYYAEGSTENRKNINTWEPLAKASLSLEYRFANMTAGITGEYGVVFEQGGRVEFTAFGICMGAVF
jgi:hypothetical protein